MKFTPSPILFAALALVLSGCEDAAETPAADEPLSQLSINSAKRQCVGVAVLQQVAQADAAGICDCMVNQLIDAEQMTSATAPTQDQQQAALDSCIASHSGRGSEGLDQAGAGND